MGGGFGAKNSAGTFVLLAAELAKRSGRPVRCVLSRREENVVGGNRNATVQRVTAAGRADGTLTALGGEYTCSLGARGWLPPTAGPTQLLYACDNVRTVEHGAKLNLPPMAAFRAPGFVEGRGRSSACSTSSRPSSASIRSSCGSATTPTRTRWTAGRSRPRT